LSRTPGGRCGVAAAVRPGLVDRAAQQRNDLVVVIPFGDVVECAVLDRLYAVGDIAVGGQQDHLAVGFGLFDPGYHLDSVAVGQFYVAQYDFRVRTFELAQARRTVFCLDHLVAFEADDAGEQSAKLGFVVDNQDFSHLFYAEEKDRFGAKIEKTDVFCRKMAREGVNEANCGYLYP